MIEKICKLMNEELLKISDVLCRVLKIVLDCVCMGCIVYKVGEGVINFCGKIIKYIILLYVDKICFWRI